MLFPSVDGQPPQATAPEELVEMLDESKENIGKAVGGTIQKTTVVTQATEGPAKGKTS